VDLLTERSGQLHWIAGASICFAKTDIWTDIYFSIATQNIKPPKIN